MHVTGRQDEDKIRQPDESKEASDVIFWGHHLSAAVFHPVSDFCVHAEHHICLFVFYSFFFLKNKIYSNTKF